jgi:hypothetical protein
MIKNNEDCYIWIDETIPEDDRTMNICCEQCHLKYPGLGWFWEGSKLGYGPFEFICNKCGRTVYDPKNTNQKSQ